jgi:leader peptidase (prepilin peptidase)/N-methyltransferase
VGHGFAGVEVVLPFKRIDPDLIPVFAAAMAALPIGLATLQGPQILLLMLLAGCVTRIALQDWRSLRVSDFMNGMVAVIGIGAWFVGIDPARVDASRTFLEIVRDVTLTGGALLLVRALYFRLRGIEGLGLGDIKLGAAAGIWIGWEDFALAVFGAALGALLFVLGSTMKHGHWSAGRRIPFASFLAPAILGAWYLGQQLAAV